MKRRIFDAVQGITRRFGYELAKSSSYSLGDPSSVGALANHLAEMLPSLKVDTVIDVGANQGQYYDFLRDRVGFKGRIVSFEPIPELVAPLRRRAASDPLWSVHDLALGRSPGGLPLHISDKTGWSSLLKKTSDENNEVAASIRIERVADVSVRTLDEVFEKLEPGLNPSSCYLKLDAQGFDLEIMYGAPTSLQWLPALQCELEMLKVYEDAPDYVRVIEFLRERGFAISGLFPIWCDRSFRVGEMDAVFRNMKPAS
jgi:FkbM family methyltransferase